MIKTRFWNNPYGESSTAVQFRTDADPMVWLHTNMGWVPIGNSPKVAAEAETFAAQLAGGYDLEECDQSYAQYMLG